MSIIHPVYIQIIYILYISYIFLLDTPKSFNVKPIFFHNEVRYLISSFIVSLYFMSPLVFSKSESFEENFQLKTITTLTYLQEAAMACYHREPSCRGGADTRRHRQHHRPQQQYHLQPHPPQACVRGEKSRLLLP